MSEALGNSCCVYAGGEGGGDKDQKGRMGLRNTRGTCPVGGWRWVRGYEVGRPEVSCTRATPSPLHGDTYLGTNILARTSGKQPPPWV